MDNAHRQLRSSRITKTSPLLRNVKLHKPSHDSSSVGTANTLNPHRFLPRSQPSFRTKPTGDNPHHHRGTLARLGLRMQGTSRVQQAMPVPQHFHHLPQGSSLPPIRQEIQMSQLHEGYDPRIQQPIQSQYISQNCGPTLNNHGQNDIKHLSSNNHALSFGGTATTGPNNQTEPYHFRVGSDGLQLEQHVWPSMRIISELQDDVGQAHPTNQPNQLQTSIQSNSSSSDSFCINTAYPSIDEVVPRRSPVFVRRRMQLEAEAKISEPMIAQIGQMPTELNRSSAENTLTDQENPSLNSTNCDIHQKPTLHALPASENKSSDRNDTSGKTIIHNRCSEIIHQLLSTECGQKTHIIHTLDEAIVDARRQTYSKPGYATNIYDTFFVETKVGEEIQSSIGNYSQDLVQALEVDLLTMRILTDDSLWHQVSTIMNDVMESR
ncbi:hypothetical protein BX600DRAFT_435817 [Xylariales sp. PMI_506]|nr:hypothetical protein BX600DRAFT_435817 [Xylariales sp. PMI_506]